VKSGGINEDEFSILLRRDGEFWFIDGGDAVANRNPLPVDKDHALGGGEIHVPKPRRRRVGMCGPGMKRCTQDPRVGADQEGLGIPRISQLQARRGVRRDPPWGICGCPSAASLRAGVEAARAGKA
jgi:hypothetical protein